MLSSQAISSIPALGQLQQRGDIRSLSVVAAAAVCSFLPLSASHLLSLLIGVGLFLAAQALQPSVDRARALAPKKAGGTPKSGSRISRGDLSGSGQGHSNGARTPRALDLGARWQRRQQQQSAGGGAAAKADPEAAPTPKAEVWKPSAQPVQAPTFSGQGWQEEVDELLSQLTPTTETNEAVASIALSIKGLVQPLLPGAEVTGFVGASLSSGKAFGVAVPEVDIVISATPDAMASRLNQRGTGKRGSGDDNTPLKLRKSAVRACTDRLVTTGGFKFRRSAFRGEEPKVVVISPPALHSDCIPRYGLAVASSKPADMTYSMASSTVAPSQPPLPPHSLGFGTQFTSCCAEKLRFPFPVASILPSSILAAATAQQEPQEPWSGTSLAIPRWLQSTADAGAAIASAFSDRSAATPRLPPPLCATRRQPRNCANSSSVRSVKALTPAVQSFPGRRFCSSISASRWWKSAPLRWYSLESLS